MYEKKADKIKAIAHPHRLCIIKGLIEGGCNVTKIQECLSLPQSTVSQHLAKLKAAGIIDGERKGTQGARDMLSCNRRGYYQYCKNSIER